MIGLVFTGMCWGQKAAGDPLTNFNESVDALIRRVAPSVVQIMVSGYRPESDTKQRNTGLTITRQRSIGSGFVIDAGGYIVTNAHVVSGAEQIRVLLPPDQSQGAIAAALSTRTDVRDACVVGIAKDLDIALLKVENLNVPALPLASYKTLRQGEMVFAFGSPGGLRNTITHGLVSSVARQTEPDSTQTFIQTDAPINPGNSGGPLVNIRGEVVGMNTFILSESGGNEGLGFAIPSATVKAAYRELRQFGRLRPQKIGIYVQTISTELAKGLNLAQDWGVIISDTLPGGPADRTGVKPGDILLSVDGQEAGNVPTVSDTLLLHDSRQKVHLEVQRNENRLSFDVPPFEGTHDTDEFLGFATSDKNLVAQLGILGIEMNRKIAAAAAHLRHRYGVIVAARITGSSQEVPLAAGDVILSVNTLPIMTLDGLREALRRLGPKGPIALQIERDGKLLYVAFSLD